MSVPLVAVPVDPPVDPWAGVWIAEDIELIAHGVASGSWVDLTLGGVSAGLDVLALVVDPAGALLQYGVAWLIEHVEPLSEALDWLAGDPAVIAAHAQTWRNVASALTGQAADLAQATRLEVADWTGTAGAAYRSWSGEQQAALGGLAKAAGALATATEAAGALIAGVRMLVRDAIATVVSRLIVYAAEVTLSGGFAAPIVVGQVVSLIATWAAKITSWLKALLASLRRLRPLLARLGNLIDSLKKILTRLRTPGHEPGGLSRVHGRGAGPRMPINSSSVTQIAEKYGIDISDVRVTINDRVSGLCGTTRPDGSVTLYRTAFQSEEDLARTLEHERFHVQELRQGRPYPADDEAAVAFEDRAYAHENQWWENHPVRPEGPS